MAFVSQQPVIIRKQTAYDCKNLSSFAVERTYLIEGLNENSRRGRLFYMDSLGLGAKYTKADGLGVYLAKQSIASPVPRPPLYFRLVSGLFRRRGKAAGYNFSFSL